jgi:hypothetical protein
MPLVPDFPEQDATPTLNRLRFRRRLSGGERIYAVVFLRQEVTGAIPTTLLVRVPLQGSPLLIRSTPARTMTLRVVFFP